MLANLKLPTFKCANSSALHAGSGFLEKGSKKVFVFCKSSLLEAEFLVTSVLKPCQSDTDLSPKEWPLPCGFGMASMDLGAKGQKADQCLLLKVCYCSWLFEWTNTIMFPSFTVHARREQGGTNFIVEIACSFLLQCWRNYMFRA